MVATATSIFPPDAMAKLAMLVPAPNTNLIRYVGVFSAHHRWREQVVPEPPADETPNCERATSKRPRPQRERRTWAELMRRAFMLDVLSCDCGGRRKVIAVIEDVKVAQKILNHLQLCAEPAVFRPPRATAASCAPRPGLCTVGDVDDVDELLDEENYSQEWAG